MFGFDELKQKITISEDTVECPVKNCEVIVPRQRGRFRRDDAFCCPKHEIYISPSTFEYKRIQDNLLWKSNQDMDLLNKISEVKRESRITRENSEDALTWNVFRFLEQNDLLAGLLEKISDISLHDPETIYWSYSQQENNSWSQLVRARKEFELNPNKGSEPDVIVKTDTALFFIEAKFLSGNKTRSSSKNPLVQKKYETGGNNWYSKIFNSNFVTIAEENKKYELLRFWLLGTWIAKEKNLDFYLLNLVLSEREKNIASLFRSHIKENSNRRFLRITWEDIFSYISKNSTKSKEINRYFNNKTIGYDSDGRLNLAFSKNHFLGF